MKNEQLKTMTRGGRRRILRNLLIYTLFILLIAAGYKLFFRGVLAEFVMEHFGASLLSFIRQIQLFVLCGIYVLGALVICVRSASHYARDLDLVSRSLTKLLDDEAEFEAFPMELRNIEMILKDVKYSIFRNEQLAREAEQQKNDLLVYLAHDLKTPLTSVIGYLALLQETPDLSMEQRSKYIGITLEKAYRLEQLINEFFDITRFNLQTMVLEKKRVDLSMMLHQIVDEFYPVFAEKGLTAVLDIESGLRVKADADKLARVFDNLLRNAVGYSYEDTCICIEAAKEETQIRVSVKNQGDEIPIEKQEQIFEKFYRVDGSRGTQGGGAGLGLAIAKEIVNLHNGTIGVTSKGQETEFTITLPDII